MKQQLKEWSENLSGFHKLLITAFGIIAQTFQPIFTYLRRGETREETKISNCYVISAN